MHRIVLTFVLLLAGCSVAVEEPQVRRAVAPPPIAVDPPREITTTTAAPDVDSFPVDILTAGQANQGGMDALGTFVLKYDPDLNCLYHLEEDNNGEPGTGGRVVIVWPFGYSAMNQQGKVVVFDETGKPVATTGVQFQIGGGGDAFDRGGMGDGGCDAIGVWYANGGPLPNP